MRVFDEPNRGNGWVCPICGKDTVKPVVLVGIAGTEDGRNIQAEQFHLDCIDLMYTKDSSILFMAF